MYMVSSQLNRTLTVPTRVFSSSTSFVSRIFVSVYYNHYGQRSKGTAEARTQRRKEWWQRVEEPEQGQRGGKKYRVLCLQATFPDYHSCTCSGRTRTE